MSIDANVRHTSRRHFLRGMGVALALPWMESLPLLGQAANAVKTNTPPLLRIGGQDVMVNESTTYDNNGAEITLADIPIGTVVRVRGNFMDDRTTVLATRINIPPPDTEEGQ